jgi:hypothetical protein
MSKTYRKHNKSKKIRKSIRNIKKCSKNNLKIMKGGDAISDKDSFFNGLSESTKTVIISASKSTSQQYLLSDLESIKKIYESKKSMQLYDFIYEKQKDGIYQLTTIWDHGIGNLDSITAGIKGVHVYVIKTNEGNFEIIGKFERKL